MNFVAIDVETANPNMASICQIGLAKYSAGVLSDEWKTYIDPQDYFDEINVGIHGIDETTVKSSPTFPLVVQTLKGYLDGSFVICHTHFDRVAIHQSVKRYQVPELKARWIDSAQVVRRTWPECAWKGYGLHKVCKMLNYDFKHHDALEDAKAAAFVFMEAVKKTGLKCEEWLERIKKPIDLSTSQGGRAILRYGNVEGPLYGQRLVFTGSLGMPRSAAADLAASVGCQVDDYTTKKTTILVVGDQDIKKLAGKEKSSKHIKAEQLMRQGCPIKILQESDFKALIAANTV